MRSKTARIIGTRTVLLFHFPFAIGPLTCADELAPAGQKALLMDLPEAVAQAFAPDGVLSRTQARFQPRAGQTEMALAVSRTITDGGALVVEAGTGIGKTFAYLVPALLSGERVLLSTATKALQDQLFGRDIIGAGYIKAYAPRGNVIHSNDVALKDYKARIFDETLGLRKVGILVDKPSLKTVAKITIKGVCKDAVRLFRDGEYSKKYKLYWLVMNPFYYIEKWKGVRLGASVDLADESSHTTYSLEHQQRVSRTNTND